MSICARQQGERRWHDVGRALSVRDSTVLVVGTGDIGSHFASICKAMGANTLGVRRDPTRARRKASTGCIALENVRRYVAGEPLTNRRR